jgi:hypothetical protein
VTLNRTVSEVWCAFFNNSVLGFFASNDACALPLLGPPPNTGIDECLQYGGPDPNDLNTTLVWSSCWNHGTWSAADFNCTCAANWAPDPAQAAVGIYGERVEPCTVCAPWFGPYPPFAPPFCLYVFAPDPVDGVLKECSGHGLFLDGACACFSNSTAGFWALAQLGPAQTCGVCVPPYGLPNCTAPAEGPQLYAYQTSTLSAPPGALGGLFGADALCAQAYCPGAGRALVCAEGREPADLPALLGLSPLDYVVVQTDNLTYATNYTGLALEWGCDGAGDCGNFTGLAGFTTSQNDSIACDLPAEVPCLCALP